MLTINHNDHVVTITESGIDQANYDVKLDLAHHVLYHFKATDLNTWGCDGVEYSVEKARGNIQVMKSTVGPRNFKKGLEAIKNCLTCQREVSHG